MHVNSLTGSHCCGSAGVEMVWGYQYMGYQSNKSEAVQWLETCGYLATMSFEGKREGKQRSAVFWLWLQQQFCPSYRFFNCSCVGSENRCFASVRDTLTLCQQWRVARKCLSLEGNEVFCCLIQRKTRCEHHLRPKPFFSKLKTILGLSVLIWGQY